MLKRIDLAAVLFMKDMTWFIGSNSFILTDAELEQIRQSAPDIFNKLNGHMHTFNNDLSQNKQL